MLLKVNSMVHQVILEWNILEFFLSVIGTLSGVTDICLLLQVKSWNTWCSNRDRTKPKLGLRGAVALCLLWVIRHANKNKLCWGGVSMRAFLVWLPFLMCYGMTCSTYKGLPDMALLPYIVWNNRFPDMAILFHVIWNGHKGHPDMPSSLMLGMEWLPFLLW